MAEFLLCNQPYRLNSLEALCGIYPDQVLDINGPASSMLVPYRPYLFSERPSPMGRSILLTLNHIQSPRDITDMALAYGGDNAVAIADFAARLREYTTGTMGAGTGLYAKRMNEFTAAVKKYQDALLEYRDVVKSNPAAKAASRENVISAYQKMQLPFKREISAVTSRIHSHKGHPLNNVGRGLRIAPNGKVAKLNFLNQVQANNFVKFGTYGKFLGGGLTVIDFGSRVGNVYNTYREGNNWEREMFIESSSFAASATTGLIAADVGSAVLVCLAALTPPGWVLVIVGLAAVGVSAGASMLVNKKFKENSGNWYDSIMKWVNKL